MTVVAFMDVRHFHVEGVEAMIPFGGKEGLAIYSFNVTSSDEDDKQ